MDSGLSADARPGAASHVQRSLLVASRRRASRNRNAALVDLRLVSGVSCGLSLGKPVFTTDIKSQETRYDLDMTDDKLVRTAG